MVLLRRSLVKVTVPTADGREALLDVRVSGDLVGEMGALNECPRSATVVTCGNAVVNVIPRGELHLLLVQHPDVAIHLAGVVAERLCWANRRRLDFTAYPVKIRLARVLAELAVTYGRRTCRGLEIDVELTEPEAATLVGASEISVQRAFRELRLMGLVEKGYRRNIVRDLAGLRELAELDPAGDKY